jgi:hypothetical protein
MWGVIMACAAVVVAAWAVVLYRQSIAERRRRREVLRRRYEIRDTGERVPLAAAAEAESMAAPGILAETAGAPAPEVGRRADDEGLAWSTATVQGRMVVTPEGEMILTEPPFALRETLLNRREAAYAAAIREGIRRLGVEGLEVCPKVRLESLVTPTPPDGRDAADWRAWRRRVRVRAVDLVVVDVRGGGWRPVVAVEVDRPAAATRVGGGVDRMVDEVLGRVGLPLVRCTGDPASDWGMIEPYIRGRAPANEETGTDPAPARA